MDRVRETYASLRSYADKGSITIEDKNIGGPLVTERHSFVTRYAAPRQFFFEFTKDPSVSQERFVIWCAGDTFSSWWSATQIAEAYAQGQGHNAFAVGEHPTSGTALLIPPLLFGNAGLTGPLLTFGEPTASGREVIEGRPCHVVSAEVRLNHWNATTRLTRLWIDEETLLVRKIFQDTPSGMGTDVVQRVTTILEPQANPPLTGTAFQFTPPS